MYLFRTAYYIQHTRKVSHEKLERQEQIREEEYDNYYYQHVNHPDSIFELRGMHFIDFTHKKIKFRFTPSECTNFVCKHVKFYCTLRFYRRHWWIKKNSIPVTYRKRIYDRHKLLQNSTLAEVLFLIKLIYENLIEWTREEEIFRKNKYEVCS